MPSPSSAARTRRGPLRPPALEQRQLDLLGLALVAAGVFLAFVVYLGWAGGQAGEGAVAVLRWCVGEVHRLAPVALVAAGAVLVLRPVLPAVRPLRTGGLCLFAAGTLGLAAGTLGAGPGGARTRDWDVAFAEAHGGMLGEGLYWLTSTLFSSTGAHIVALFLLVAGTLLLTGASVAGVLQRTSRRVRSTTTEVTAAVAARRRAAAEELAALEAGGEADATVSRPRERTRAPAPASDPAPDGSDGFWSGDERFPDLYGGEPPATKRAEPPAEAAPDAPTPDRPPAPPADPEPPAEPRLAEDVDEPGVTRTARRVEPPELTPQGRLRREVTESPDFDWLVPEPDFLQRSSERASRPDTVSQEKVAAQLVEALAHFNVRAQVIGMVSGPHITRYEIRLAPGIKVGKVANLKDDLAYALAAADIRILAPIPGKQAVGIEVPNANRQVVRLGDVLQAPPEGWSPLTVWLGKDVAGRAIGCDLAKMPHLLVAGTTGAGKSGCVNAMLASILLRATPHEVRMVLVDPKQVELNHYESIPHLLTPVITNPKKAAIALQNLVREMEQRYTYMSLARTRSLDEMNRVREGRGEPRLPYVLCVIDELADLMMVAPADVEDSIIRLAQKARAVGIHLVLATQSPRVDVITGMIKANVPSRIAFAVSSQTDSRVILDSNGAESLLGMGDMLFAPVGSSRLQRIQGAYVEEPEIAALTAAWRRQGEPELDAQLLEPVEEAPEAAAGEDPDFDPDEDPLLEEAIRLVAEMGTASTSMLQRRLRLGYTRAGRLIDMLERRGVISGYEGSKPRQVLVGEADLPRVLAALDGSGEAAPEPGDAEREAPAEAATGPAAPAE